MAKAFGAKDITKTMRRISQVDSAPDGGVAENQAEESSSEEDFQAALDKKDRIIAAKETEIKELKMQLAAAGAGGGVATGKSAALLNKSKQIKGELMSTLQSAIDAIELVEKRTRERVDARQ